MKVVLFINFIAVLLALGARNGRVQFMTISQLILSLFYGLRYDYGNDYWNYYDIFLQCSSNVDPEIIEPGWGVINLICQPVGFMGMIFFVTLFEYYVIYKHIKIYVPQRYWWLAVLVFSFTFNFQLLGCSMMRQFLSMVILLYSIKYIVSRELIKFVIVTAIASSIHKTALVFLPIYFLGGKVYDIRDTKSIIIGIVVFLYLLLLSTKYIEYFQVAGAIFDDEKFNRYLEGDGSSYSFTILFDILWLILLMRTCPSQKSKNVICLISIISYVLLPFIFDVVMLLRLMLFFSFFFIFSIPNMFNSLKRPLLRYGFLCVYIFLMLKRSLASMGGETYGEFYNTFQTIFSAPKWI